ncbi:membrane protein [Gordonia phage Herod]|uniref:Membrane protein n=1 Tax=Gordonia phage Herod TaxID=2776861 RepID=A0A7M1CTN7_9CAUD|nr:membrane protein [Gordonia phage Herod]QOP67378.1 membrane protein [Gordonia phage Herod]
MTMHETVRLNVDPNHEHVHTRALPRPIRIVNRVPTLHRPLPADALFGEIVAYWQRRIPAVDMTTIAHEALTETFEIICAALGLDPDQLDTALIDDFHPAGDFLADAPETEARIVAALHPKSSEPVLIGKTWRARRREWGELAVMGVISALIVIIGGLLVALLLVVGIGLWEGHHQQ